MALPDLRPDPPIRAKVRIGIKENGKPKATDSFHCDDRAFIEKFGTPKTLDITFPFPEPRDAMRDGLELWLGNATLKCWSKDGEHANRLSQTGDYEDARCLYKDCPQFKSKKCSQIGRLRFQIPELGHGLFVLDTKGWNTMSALLGTLQLYAPLNPKQPFRLRVEQRKNARKQTFSVVVLEAIEPESENE